MLLDKDLRITIKFQAPSNEDKSPFILRVTHWPTKQSIQLEGVGAQTMGSKVGVAVFHLERKVATSEHRSKKGKATWPWTP